MNRIVKDALILTIITLVSGCLLGLVFEITKDPIAKAEYEAQQKAYQTVFSDAAGFEDYGGFDAEAAAGIVASSNYPENTIEGVVEAKDASGNTLGYVITMTSHSGYGGDITFSVGIRNDGTLNGYSITSISETAGLGMKAKEEAFSSQFVNKSAGVYEVTKNGAVSEDQIDAISGATITSRAMTYGVDAALVYFGTLVEGGSVNE